MARISEPGGRRSRGAKTTRPPGRVGTPILSREDFLDFLRQSLSTDPSGIDSKGRTSAFILVDLLGVPGDAPPDFFRIDADALAQAMLVLQRLVRSRDTIGQIGGHEIAVAVDGGEPARLRATATRIEEALAMWARYGPAGVPVRAHVCLVTSQTMAWSPECVPDRPRP